MTAVRETEAAPFPTLTGLDVPRSMAPQSLRHPARFAGDGTRWSLKYRRVLAASDFCVIASVSVGALETRFGLDDAKVSVGWVRVDYSLISILIAAAWMLALGACQIEKKPGAVVDVSNPRQAGGIWRTATQMIKPAAGPLMRTTDFGAAHFLSKPVLKESS